MYLIMENLKYNNLTELMAFNIKYYRYLKGLSQEQLAELSHLSPEYISRIERGLNSPTIDKLETIAKALNMDAYIFLKQTKIDNAILSKMTSTRQYNQYNMNGTKK